MFCRARRGSVPPASRSRGCDRRGNCGSPGASRTTRPASTHCPSRNSPAAAPRAGSPRPSDRDNPAAACSCPRWHGATAEDGRGFGRPVPPTARTPPDFRRRRVRRWAIPSGSSPAHPPRVAPVRCRCAPGRCARRPPAPALRRYRTSAAADRNRGACDTPRRPRPRSARPAPAARRCRDRPNAARFPGARRGARPSSGDGRG